MIRVEVAKLFRRPRTYVIAGILCALPFLVAVLLATTRIPPPPGEVGAFLSAVLGNGALYPAAAMALVMPILLPASVALLAGDAIAGEQGSGTLRYLLVRPVGRARLLVAKLLCQVVFVLFAVTTVLLTSYLTGITLFGSPPDAAAVLPAEVTSLSGAAITPTGLAARLLATIGYITVSMLSVAAFALLLSTFTDSPLGAAMGTLAALIASHVLLALDAAAGLWPYLPTRHWLAWVDFFRDPILWRDVERGLGLQAIYLVVLLGAAWANFLTKDVS